MADNRLVTIANINNLMNLETLDISGNCLEFLSDDICGLKNLKSLNVSKNKLTNRGIAPGIFDLGLESLDLSKNKIVDAVPELLLFVGKVKDVKLHENPWANEKLAGIQESTTKDEIDLIVKEIQDSKPKEALEPPKPFSDATSPDVVTDTSPKGVMQPQAPAIPPKKKPSKKLAIGTVQRENSLKSISEQTTGELSPGTDAPPPQITPRLSEAEPLQQAAPRISEIVSPQIDGPSRTGETLKPMSRAKGPKKKNSISDAPSPESKAPAPRASSN